MYGLWALIAVKQEWPHYIFLFISPAGGGMDGGSYSPVASAPIWYAVELRSIPLSNIFDI